MDPERIMNGISKEISAALKAMAKADSPEEKLRYSEVVKNLCDSLGVFLHLLSDMGPYDYEEEEDDKPIPF